MNLPVNISERAKEEIILIKKNKNIPDEYGLRITLDAAGCSGVNYRIGFDKKGEGDDEFELDGVPVFIKRKDFMYLVGVSLDFVEDESQKGFLFK